MVARAVDNEAPYFVDYIGEVLDATFPGIVAKPGTLDVYTTLDLNLQRHAQDAVREGIAVVDKALARRKRGPARVAQAALVAIDPRSGEILAFIGGRSYNQSQFNRAVSARRQIGSTFKPFVYLAAFEKAADDGTGDITPATLVYDEPTTWSYDNQEWSPKNYDGEYDGAITLRRALAMSRNIAAVKVAEQTGYERVVSLWKRAKIGETDQVKPYPSVALGIVELTPLEVAEAYTVFTGQGRLKKLRAMLHVTSGEDTATPKVEPGPVVARPAAAYLVTHMLRSVLNEGTGASARANGFTVDAAGKSGHHERSSRRVVCRLHSGVAHRGVGRPRQQSAARVERLTGGAADLDVVHEECAGRPRRFVVRGAGRRQLHRDRSRYRQDRHAGVPARDERSLPRRHRAPRRVRTASISLVSAGTPFLHRRSAVPFQG